MSDNPSITKTELLRFNSTNDSLPAPDWLAREEPLEIRVRSRSVAVTMRTPGHDQELAAGFLISEGILRERRHLVEIAHCTTGENAHLGNIVNVFLSPEAPLDFDRLTRHVFASSSCGLCGKASIDSVQQHFPPSTSTARVHIDALRSLPSRLMAGQSTFASTGGLHAAGLFDSNCEPIVIREDIGRHNAVDKVIGHAFLRGQFPLHDHVLIVSGRASFEIIQKALSAGIPIVTAISAPSSLAVEFARACHQTLVAFLRGESFNVYSHPERLTP